jgi:hypothetical protein
MSDISNFLIKDSFDYVLQSDLSTGVIYRIGGTVPTNPVFSSGLTINGAFKYQDGSESNGYVLTSDANGNATWKLISGDYLSLSGGTITGNTTFTSGLTVNVLSAATYLNLPQYIRKHDFSSPYSYNGYALSGSSESANVWTITRINVNVDGSTTKGTATNVSWTGRASHTYIQDYYTFDFINCDSQYKTVYSSGSSLNIGVRIFTNSSLTTSAANDYYCIDNGNYSDCWVVTGGNGVITSINSCN